MTVKLPLFPVNLEDARNWSGESYRSCMRNFSLSRIHGILFAWYLRPHGGGILYLNEIW